MTIVVPSIICQCQLGTCDIYESVAKNAKPKQPDWWKRDAVLSKIWWFSILMLRGSMNKATKQSNSPYYSLMITSCDSFNIIVSDTFVVINGSTIINYVAFCSVQYCFRYYYQNFLFWIVFLPVVFFSTISSVTYYNDTTDLSEFDIFFRPCCFTTINKESSMTSYNQSSPKNILSVCLDTSYWNSYTIGVISISLSEFWESDFDIKIKL